jgi:primosomal protein N' (replication factor Y)
MYYYEVLVGSLAYHGDEPLTYSSPEQLPAGSVVRVGLRSRSVLGLIARQVARPSFEAKPVSAVAPFPPVPTYSLELLEWLRSYYPAPLGAAVRLFVPPTETFPRETPTINDQRSTINEIPLPPLTAEQEKALKDIQGPGSFLLHGITGSGKSRVYVELPRRCLASGHSAMILTPEIGLTTQLTDTFEASFGSRVFVLHSRQTAAQRRDIWYALLAQTEPVVVIGPRSALFSPVKNIGLIVLDEAHDDAYKNESAPHYHAGRVAAKLAQLCAATFVSGSATPSVEAYYVAAQRQRPIIAMHHLAKTSDHTPVSLQTVDLKDHQGFSRSSILSDVLLQAITTTLGRNEQTLLFLNRRGTANVVLCNNCGWQTACPNCDLPLTYHGDEHRLRCHECGFVTARPTTCPQGGNTER